LPVAGVVICLLLAGAVFAFKSVSEIRPATPAGAEKRVPADLLDLTNWRLALPTGKDDADQVDQPELATFQDKDFFHLNRAKNGVVFRANAGGTTTDGSDYPRSELREMIDGGKKEAAWSNASGDHIMTITQAITAVPPRKPEVVAGQIHDDEDDVIMIRLEKSRLFVEADGDEVGVLNPAYSLGTKFTVQIRATPDGIKVTYDGRTSVTYDKVGSDYYFKAGCYTQSNTDEDAPDAAGEVVIYDLKVEHIR
jgi:poly(beta-D-mannuronate) lyase